MVTAVLAPVREEATAPAAPLSSAVVKLSLRGETFRIPFNLHELNWRTLEAQVDNCYDDAHRPAVWTLIYRDDEDDLVTVSNQREFVEALRVFAELKDAHTTDGVLHLHFHVVAKLSLKEQLAPVMHAVTEITEKMVKIAADTRDSLRKSSYVERGRDSLYHSAVHTRDALSSAGRGLSQRVRRASIVVVDEISVLPRRLRTRSRVSSQDVREDVASPLTLMATNVEHASDEDAPAEMDVADMLARARAEEEAAERSASEEEASDAATNEVALQRVAMVAPADDADEEATGHASDADTASTASEDTHDEWDVVRSSSPHRPLSPYIEVEADDEVEVSFTLWESQLATIRDIMPQIDRDLCLDVLNKHDGNLEAALVELTEL